MTTTFQLESWRSYYGDPARETLWNEHYEELLEAHDRKMPMSPDIATYQALERSGQLEILVARQAGNMVGYCLFLVKRHLHYDALCLFEDSYYVGRAARQGLGKVGYGLVMHTLERGRVRGAIRAYFMTKEFASIARLLEHLGGTKMDTVYTFWLEN